MSKRVLLHVGTPKTGTSYLQDVLFRNRRTAGRATGILYPADRFDAHFLAALDLMRLPWGGLETEAVGAWDRLAQQVRELGRHRDHQPRDPGHRVAQRRSTGRSTSLGHPDVEVHVVLSVRDLVRQIPAEWQENVKHRRELSYGRFLAGDPEPRSARAGSPPGSGASRRSPTSSTAGATTCRRSACTWSPCPAPGEPPDLLWERFSQALRARPASTSTSRASGPTRPSACPRPRCCAGSTSGPTTPSSRRATGRWSASCSPTRPCRAARARRG